MVQPIYPQTAVRVINADCLHVYADLTAQRYRPVLLNMANAQTPGGGYRRGAEAQEENIFRRSNYFLGLDSALDSERRCEYFRYSDQGEQQRVSPHSLYPMSTFGALYTQDITVFRDSEDDGYAFLNEPVHNVCTIAMAAYQNPPLKQGNHLPSEYAANTRKKIENIFAIAQHQKHDCLVLSALGCGAFKNPPEDIARLFKTVILQYAGVFHSIIFAIIGEQNSSNDNFASFHNLLHNYNISPPAVPQVGMALGSHRIREIRSNGQMILDNFVIARDPCKYGGMCNKTSYQDHSARFSHPSVCPQQTPHCITDMIHYRAFVHR
ncbi:unnamed protein product [Adineta steineri]|uniref:Microbial-type PARG catalytic domain-containing protein n=1 Tax=Adineta steineri TaxID=433720 RepID=A0A818Q4G4_9BILA|nr:unnamed protein product [Adineta steineri]CAF3635464.1 unnamed protein product [Adineta steineri]